MRIGILLPNWIGDVAMATPALRAVRRRFGPSSHVTGIMRPYVVDVLAGTPWIDDVLLFDPKHADRQLGSWAVARRLRELRLDHLILLTNSLRAAAIAWLSGAKRRFGYARNGRAPLLTDTLVPPRKNGRWDPIAATDYYLQLVSLLGCETSDRELELATTNADEEQADRIWGSLGWTMGTRVLALCPGGAYGAAKHWPAESFAELGRRAVQEFNCRSVILCGPAEREFADEIQRQANHPAVVSLADEPPSIGLSKACLRRCQLAVTTDSGPRHLAAGFGVPTVALFGPTDPLWSLNYNPQEVRLQQTDLDCMPCAERTCPLGHHRCMQELSVDRVLAAVDRLWEGRRRLAA